MKLDFDIGDVTVTEFGVGRDDGDERTFHLMTVDSDVQCALREMAIATSEAMRNLTDAPSQYEPSEKHAGVEYLHLPLNHNLAVSLHQLHVAANLPVDASALADPATVFCYFARMTDGKGRRLTALRRATQFKGVLKSRLIRLVTDALKLVEDKVFKLDIDFDLLVDAKAIHILRPSGFEFIGMLQDAVLAAVPQNIAAIQKDLRFVDFASIREYASKHPRAARYLASIRSQKETKDTNKSLLKSLCKSTSVEVVESNGMVTVQLGHEMGFLEVLDRRRYELELVKGSPEQFKAASREKING